MIKSSNIGSGMVSIVAPDALPPLCWGGAPTKVAANSAPSWSAARSRTFTPMTGKVMLNLLIPSAITSVSKAHKISNVKTSTFVLTSKDYSAKPSAFPSHKRCTTMFSNSMSTPSIQTSTNSDTRPVIESEASATDQTCRARPVATAPGSLFLRDNPKEQRQAPTSSSRRRKRARCARSRNPRGGH